MAKSPHPQGQRSKRKGTPYEDAIADLLANFLPGATIVPGKWITGPYARRELDVFVSLTLPDGTVRKGVIECKDYDPAKTGPVGIEVLDNLDSKRSELALDFAAICSNAGFTDGAIRKARGVRVALLAAANTDDHRIRFFAVDERPVRHLRIVGDPRVNFRWRDPSAPIEALLASGQPTFNGRLVSAWVLRRLGDILVANPIVNWTVRATWNLREPVELTFPAGTATALAIGGEVEVEGAWFLAPVQFDSDACFYDWLQRQLQFPLPRRQIRLGVRNFNAYAGTWIERPAEWNLTPAGPGFATINLMVFKERSLNTDNPAHLDPLVVKEDASYFLPNVPLAAMTSKPGFPPNLGTHLR